MTMDELREESKRIGEGEHPNFIVSSGSVGAPFLTSDAALLWQSLMQSHGVETVVYECSNYDWDENPAGFQFNAVPKQVIN